MSAAEGAAISTFPIHYDHPTLSLDLPFPIRYDGIKGMGHLKINPVAQ